MIFYLSATIQPHCNVNSAFFPSVCVLCVFVRSRRRRWVMMVVALCRHLSGLLVCSIHLHIHACAHVYIHCLHCKWRSFVDLLLVLRQREWNWGILCLSYARGQCFGILHLFHSTQSIMCFPWLLTWCHSEWTRLSWYIPCVLLSCASLMSEFLGRGLGPPPSLCQLFNRSLPSLPLLP